MIDLRRHPRVKLESEVTFSKKGTKDAMRGSARDISLGGMFIETDFPLAHNTELTVNVLVPGQAAPFAIPAIVRWQAPDGMGVQFGLIGARETHAITEAIARHAPSGMRERAATLDEIDVDVDDDVELTG